MPFHIRGTSSNTSALALVSFVWLSACQSPVESTVRATPTTVMGLDRGAVEQLLGRPGFVHRESPAEIWQYQTTSCVLDVFLYDVAVGQRVTYVEARSTEAAEPMATATAACHRS